MQQPRNHGAKKTKKRGRPSKAEITTRSESAESRVQEIPPRLGAIECPRCGRSVHINVKRKNNDGERIGDCPFCGCTVAAKPLESVSRAAVRIIR